MDLIQAIILGIIQGVTEFLPVSSSGHIELGKAIFGIDLGKENLLFTLVLHLATALSTMVVYRKDIFDLTKGLLAFKNNVATRFSLMIFFSMIPAGLVGVLFDEQLEKFFSGDVLLVGLMLLLTGGLLLFTHYAKSQNATVNTPRAWLIGIAQAIAILPGISRSGATISTALLSGVSRDQAARFSFLMVLPLILGASVLKLKDWLELPATDRGNISATFLAIGFVAAFISGWAACKFMITIVRKGKLTWFAVYCFVVGSIAIIYTLV